MFRVLIADDEESLRIALRATLEKAGHQVHVVSGGQAALEALRTRDFHVALIDVRMPDLDGISVCGLVAKESIAATIVVMSAYGSVDDARAALRAGAYDYLTKPFKPREVEMAVALAGEREVRRRENARIHQARTQDRGLVFRSEAMQQVMAMVDKVARVDSTVLLVGESGTGKEMVARAIWSASMRADAPLIAVNCGAIPENLIEAELFGHTKGAFTDASTRRDGLFKQADGGTLLLDEIGELPLPLQVKLLRVLQEGTFRPLGASADEWVDVRIVAATVQNLEELVRQGRFREDLYYRINVLPIRIPPLRERKDDILLLAEHFIARNNTRLGTQTTGLTKEAEQRLLDYGWPGNVRELQNVIERAQVLAEGETITADDLPSLGAAPIRGPVSLLPDELSIKKTTRYVEETLIRRALERTGGNRSAAARLLEISHRALLYKIKDYGI